MFVKWNWEKVINFGRKVDIELKALRECNETIFAKPSLTLTVPHDEFTAYQSKCFTGQAMEYVRSSMYIMAFRNFMRLFDAKQFLVIFTEVGQRWLQTHCRPPSSELSLRLSLSLPAVDLARSLPQSQ